jgi:hypothetical protein
LSWDLRLFFFYAANQPLLWIATFGLVILSQAWCEYRSTRLE